MDVTPAPALNWLLAYTKPHGEALAEENLRRQGFETLSPLLRVHRRRREHWHWVEEPLFPRYVFVGVPEGQAWAPIRSTIGVASLVRFGGRVATVPDLLIEELRTAGDLAGPQRTVFLEGQKVRIVGSGYSGLEGVFQMQDGQQRAHVLISLLGRPTVVRVPLDEVVAG